MRFNRLQPSGDPASADDLLASDGPLLRVNFVASLDGRAAVEGSARELGGEGDLEMLVALRRWAQALIVGPGTIRAEGYGRIRSDLPVAIISRRFDIAWEAGLFAAADQPVIVYTEAEDAAPEVAAQLEVVRMEQATPRAVVDDLHARGHGRILSEGGPTLFRGLLADGVVDELFLTLDPVLTGDEGQPRILEGLALPEPARARLLWVLEAGGDLFLRYGLSGS